MTEAKKHLYQALGRRKESTARITMHPGTGSIIVNDVEINKYFKYATTVQDIKQGLVLTETANKYDIIVNVKGGGFTGQAGAVRLAIARGLVKANPDFKTVLKKAGLITRDSRSKERKKYGKYGARRSPQFSKR